MGDQLGDGEAQAELGIVLADDLDIGPCPGM